MSSNFFEGGQKAIEWENLSDDESFTLYYDGWTIQATQEQEPHYMVHSPDNLTGEVYLTANKNLELTMAFVEIFHTLVVSFENQEQ